MEFDILYILVGVVILLGVGDLIVGVSNDAVNFMNSAIASKVATRKVIMIVATIGIFIGAASSSGMMEVARKGIFRPEMFQLEHLFMIFLAVMLSDIILLDLYNTLGLPTSTTVSLVFELLGASVAVAMWATGGDISLAFERVAAGSALTIILGIFLSVVVAFIAGLIVQSFFRLLFTFEFSERIKKLGGVFGGLCASILILFLMVKGLKKAAFVSKEHYALMTDNMGYIFLGSFVIFSILLHFLVSRGVNIFKFIILMGTGALAMAFAGNDLVNFIGVPIAGFQTFTFITEGAGTDLGTSLAAKLPSPDFALLAAGGIMALTLWLSKKSRSMSNTEISLASQADAVQVFESNMVARMLVQISFQIQNIFKSVIPGAVKRYIDRRFQKPEALAITSDYDLLRASNNIMTASIIIMIGTLLKMPLSTTFVTFMVAMGTSLADRSWGRENAVQRVSGVLTVIGGWVATAFIASITAAIIVSIIFVAGFYSALAILGLAIFLIYSFAKMHKKKQAAYDKTVKTIKELHGRPDAALSRTVEIIIGSFNQSNEATDLLVKAAGSGKRKPLRRADKIVTKLRKDYETSMTHVIRISKEHFEERDFLSSHSLTNAHTVTRHIVGSLSRMIAAVRNRIEIFHTPLTENEIKDINEMVTVRDEIAKHFKDNVDDLAKKPLAQTKAGKKLAKLRADIQKNQIKRIREGEGKVTTSLPYVIMIDELAHINSRLIELLFDLNKVATWVKRKQTEAE